MSFRDEIQEGRGVDLSSTHEYDVALVVVAAAAVGIGVGDVVIVVALWWCWYRSITRMFQMEWGKWIESLVSRVEFSRVACS